MKALQFFIYNVESIREKQFKSICSHITEFSKTVRVICIIFEKGMPKIMRDIMSRDIKRFIRNLKLSQPVQVATGILTYNEFREKLDKINQAAKRKNVDHFEKYISFMTTEKYR